MKKRISNIKFLTSLSLICVSPVLLTTLTSCETNKDNKVNECINIITALTDSSSEEEVKAARDFYESLNDDEKSKISLDVLSILMNQENRIANQKAVQEVISLINNLNENSTQEEVANARNKYNALSSEAKALVTNLDHLLEIETTLNEKASANAFKEYLYSVNLDTLDEQIVDEVQNRYNSLSEKAKSYLSQEDDALYKKILDYLKKPALDLNEQMAALIALDDDLFAISKREEADKILDDYNSLKNEYKSLVTNYDSFLEKTSVFDNITNLFIDNIESPFALSGYNASNNVYPNQMDKSYNEDVGVCYRFQLNSTDTSGKTFDLKTLKEYSVNTIKAFKSLFCYFYSPCEVEMCIIFQDANGNAFGNHEVNNIKKGWNKIELDSSLLKEFNCPLVGLTSWKAKFSPTQLDGFKITPFYGVKDPIKDVNEALEKVATTLEGKTDIEKIQNLSKFEYSKKLISKLNETNKKLLDQEKINNLTAIYADFGESIFGFEDDETFTTNDGDILSISKDKDSDFAKNYGEVFKVTFASNSALKNHELDFVNLDATFNQYSKLVIVGFDDLYAWGSKDGYADYIKLFDYSTSDDSKDCRVSKGIPGYFNDDGYGKGITILEWEVNKEITSPFAGTKFIYQNTWGSPDPNKSNLYFTSLFGLK